MFVSEEDVFFYLIVTQYELLFHINARALTVYWLLYGSMFQRALFEN